MNLFEMTKNWFGKNKKQEKKSVENLNWGLLMTAGGALLAPAFGFPGGLKSACGVLLESAARDFVVKAAGFSGGLWWAPAILFTCGFLFRKGDGQKLMKAPGRPGEFIKRTVFERNPGDYFRRLRGK